MKTKLLYNIINLNLTKKFGLRVLGIAVLSLFMSLQSSGQSFILDLQYNPMSFTNAQRTVITDIDHSNGLKPGSVHKYNNVITISGITVYAKMTIVAVNNATIKNFDDDVLTGDSKRFQPRIGSNNSNGGYITYQLEFFDTQTNYPVYIYNYYLTAIDIDGNGGNREYVEVGGYSSYQKSSQCGLTITTDQSTKRTRFLGISTSLPDVTFDNTASFIANYLNANNRITFNLGQTGSNDERYYSVQFGAKGGTLTDPSTINNPLPVAVDDNATVNYFASGNAVTAIPNVLSNDLYNGANIVPSQVTISQVTAPSNSGVRLDVATGKVSVAPGTPAGIYTLTYQVSVNASPANVDVATVTIKVLQADLAITKTVTPNPVLAGQNIRYTITVTNNGPTEAQAVAVADAISANLTNVTTTPSTGTWSAPNWTIGLLASGASASLTIDAKVLPSYSGSFINSATVTSSTPDPNTANNTANANLTVTALSGPTAGNDVATTNAGKAVTINVLSNDNKGSGDIVASSVTFVGTIPDPATVGTFTANTAGVVTFTPAAGFFGVATVTYKITDVNNLSAQATITCTIIKADIEINKTAALSVVDGNQYVTYTLTAKNNGPNDAIDVVVSDPLPASVTYSSATTPSTGTWDPALYKWTIGTLTNGSSATMKITDKINSGFTGNLVNNASITSTTGDPTLSNNTVSVTTPVTNLTGPSASDDNATTEVGIPVTIHVLDNDHSGSGLIDVSKVTFVPGTIPNASTVGTFTVDNTGVVTFSPVASFTGSTTVKYNIVDANNLSAQATITCTINKANLGITKTAVLGFDAGNQIITYTITVTNAGPDAAKDVVATDNLPTSLTLISATPSIGNWTAPTWNIGNMVNGAHPTLTIVAKVGADAIGTLSNTASVTSTTADPDLTNNTVTVTSNAASGPHAVDDNTTTTVNTSIPIIVLANDTKGSSDIVVTSVTLVPGTEPATSVGVFTVNQATGVVTFVPATGYLGTASIKYKILDGNGLSSQATITVTVTASLVNNFPATGFGTLAFEDLWPSKGDYDLNDLVLDYRFQVTSNANNFVEKVVGTFVIKAFGASLENGFGFQLPAAIKSNDLTVSGYNLTDGFINLNNNGTESGQTKSTIIVYDNAFKQMTSPGGIGVNTDPNQPYVQPKTLTITINVTPNKYTLNDLDILNFNPFLIVNKVRGVEVHLPDYPPTTLADRSLLGTADDNSNPSLYKYYKTANNLPWAINFYTQFAYPIEKADIIQVYLHFAEWATSGGTLYKDWYKNYPGYRNASLIYQIPQ